MIPLEGTTCINELMKLYLRLTGCFSLVLERLWYISCTGRGGVTNQSVGASGHIERVKTRLDKD